MQTSTAPVLFQSSDEHAVINDHANQDWIGLIGLIQGVRFDVLARRYYLALHEFRKLETRPPLPGQVELKAQGKQQAFQEMLHLMEQRKATRRCGKAPLTAQDVLVDPRPVRPVRPEAQDLADALSDFSVKPPPLSAILGGAGRPPCDALCLLRAFLAAPLLGVGDGPTEVHRLLHSNPVFAHLCGFLGRTAAKQPMELTSRRLPSQAVCEEFSEVMTRYGLWHQARLEQVMENLARGVIAAEPSLAFDTTHVEANSHCGNVVPPQAAEDQDSPPRQRKVPRLRKRCACGQEHWDSCPHDWVPTDQGAAVVVKGPTRVYWGHKTSVAALPGSQTPIDVRVCLYGAEHDGHTLVPHLEVLQRDLPQVTAGLRYVLADDAYQGNEAQVARFGQSARLVLPVHPRKAPAGLAEQFRCIDHFTPVGFPVCVAGHRFELLGRDVVGQHYLWAAPLSEQGQSVCKGCPRAVDCLVHGLRRQLRVSRQDQPQICWEHPQLLARERARYGQRTAVERAIKRLKVDLGGEYLTHRDGQRVQAHLDRKLLTLHLLLVLAAAP
jgi:hypothetical protein